ncbi:hypothetical protein IC575_002361 [Cucumis melo]
MIYCIYLITQIHTPKLSNIINNNQIRIQINNSLNLRRQNLRQINPRIIQRLIQSLTDRFRYFPSNPTCVESINPKFQIRKCRFDTREHLPFKSSP